MERSSPQCCSPAARTWRMASLAAKAAPISGAMTSGTTIRAKRAGTSRTTWAAIRRAAASGRALRSEPPRSLVQPPAAWTSDTTPLTRSRGLRLGWPASAPRSARSLASSTNRTSTSARAVIPTVPSATPPAGGAADDTTAAAAGGAGGAVDQAAGDLVVVQSRVAGAQLHQRGRADLRGGLVEQWLDPLAADVAEPATHHLHRIGDEPPGGTVVASADAFVRQPLSPGALARRIHGAGCLPVGNHE